MAIGTMNVLYKGMKTLQVNLPDQVARDVENSVKDGKFQTADEVVLAALREFISRRRLELKEQQQLKDIAWALNEKPAGKSCGSSPTRVRTCKRIEPKKIVKRPTYTSKTMVAAVGQALRRAAKDARKTARMYGIPIYIMRNGKIVAEKP